MAGVMNMPVNIAKLLREQLAAQTALINTNTDSSAGEVNANVDAELDANLQGINAHTSAEVSSISLDLYAGAAGENNVMDSFGGFNGTKLGTGENGVRESRFYREGSGVITALSRTRRQDIEIWIDGTLFISSANDGYASFSSLVGHSSDLKYIVYKTSIEIFITNNFSGTQEGTLRHVMTG